MSDSCPVLCSTARLGGFQAASELQQFAAALPLTACAMLPPHLQVGGLQAPSELQQFVAAVLVMRQVEAGSDGQRAQLVE